MWERSGYLRLLLISVHVSLNEKMGLANGLLPATSRSD
jgi:hypothetical protein